MKCGCVKTGNGGLFSVDNFDCELNRRVMCTKDHLQDETTMIYNRIAVISKVDCSNY